MSKVRIIIPENKIIFIDYLLNRRVKMVYNPEMKLCEIKRFYKNPWYRWLIYSNDLDKEISINKTLKSQGVQEGDILEVISEIR